MFEQSRVGIHEYGVGMPSRAGQNHALVIALTMFDRALDGQRGRSRHLSTVVNGTFGRS
ncbi:MAG: hypothetical protein MSG64_10680 [Pyrinomonadaceae bacterium MAG19_C2-C3]|nr:hypothetical protein [Pyrinomonadaceae bacterium MAG19_C2-C3]